MTGFTNPRHISERSMRNISDRSTPTAPAQPRGGFSPGSVETQPIPTRSQFVLFIADHRARSHITNGPNRSGQNTASIARMPIGLAESRLQENDGGNRVPQAYL